MDGGVVVAGDAPASSPMRGARDASLGTRPSCGYGSGSTLLTSGRSRVRKTGLSGRAEVVAVLNVVADAESSQVSSSVVHGENGGTAARRGRGRLEGMATSGAGNARGREVGLVDGGVARARGAWGEEGCAFEGRRSRTAKVVARTGGGVGGDAPSSATTSQSRETGSRGGGK